MYVVYIHFKSAYEFVKEIVELAYLSLLQPARLIAEHGKIPEEIDADKCRHALARFTTFS